MRRAIFIAVYLLMFAIAHAANTYQFVDAASTVVQRSDGAVVPWNPVANQPADMDGFVGQVWQQDGSPTPLPYVAPIAPSPTLSFSQFMGLFTQAEQLAIAGSTDPQVKLFVIMATGQGATGIQLGNVQVMAGVDYLTTTSPAILTTAEATRILAGTPPAQ
jgi:hypothetical protein